MSLNNFNQRNYQCKFSASELNEMHLPVDSVLCLAQVTVMHETLDAKCKSDCKMIVFGFVCFFEKRAKLVKLRLVKV